MVVGFTRCTTLCDKVSVTCDMSVVFSTNKTDHHDIAEILLKLALNTIKQTKQKQIFIEYNV